MGYDKDGENGSSSKTQNEMPQKHKMKLTGGWPYSLRKKSNEAKLIVAKDYLRNVCESDVSTVDGVKRNPTLAELIVRAYARNVSTLMKKAAIFKDVAANMESVSDPMLDSYLNALERLFVIEDVETWCPAIHSNPPGIYTEEPAIIRRKVGRGYDFMDGCTD